MDQLAATFQHLDLATPPDAPWPRVVEVYLAARATNGNTRRAYRRHLIAALGRIGRRTVAEVTGADLAAVRLLVLRNGLAPASQAQALAALRSLFLWARKPHVGACSLSVEVIEDALQKPRVTVRRPYCVATDEEVVRLLGSAKTDRDVALLAVMAGAGLRVSEVAALDISDVRELPEGGGMVWVRQGKGAKDRWVPATNQVLRMIRTYLEGTGRALANEGPLFCPHDRGADKRNGSRLSARAIGDTVAAVVREARIVGKTLSPHSLRHTFALRYLRAGGNIVALAEILGHASVETTQRYLKHMEFADLIASLPNLPEVMPA